MRSLIAVKLAPRPELAGRERRTIATLLAEEEAKLSTLAAILNSFAGLKVVT